MTPASIMIKNSTLISLKNAQTAPKLAFLKEKTQETTHVSHTSHQMALVGLENLAQLSLTVSKVILQPAQVASVLDILLMLLAKIPITASLDTLAEGLHSHAKHKSRPAQLAVFLTLIVPMMQHAI
eukprot:CAMPEP_0202948342 /NCGR_PEP_ID=MMETSP1395-20130829/13254_1 /ASSEMBLY_ACC=CAM_ASM_000871 /TAXON_ID=5961 /ORGANISM="Blepharisma japonicum, Strain Stock R1072" /LENGTH=125 /DNA_ID=CAMNT_0049650299 /DNA_START=142 /DNA_END=519 /DNA_ORIENTATION=+